MISRDTVKAFLNEKYAELKKQEAQFSAELADLKKMVLDKQRSLETVVDDLESVGSHIKDYVAGVLPRLEAEGEEVLDEVEGELGLGEDDQKPPLETLPEGDG